MGFLNQLWSSPFLPHGTCYLWNPRIVWLHVISDTLITVSYYFIPLVLVYLVRKRRDIPFNGMFWMFGLFILGCGTTHLMEVWTVWRPVYLLSGVVKAVTAAVSLVTAIMLVPLVPKALALTGPEQLLAINRELQKHIVARAQREAELTRLTEDLDLRIQDRTAELEAINKSLQKEIALGREAQAALRTSQARLSSVIESAMDAILTVDEEQRIVLFNRAAERMFACTAQEVRGQSLDRFIPERSRAVHAEHIQRFGATGVTNRTMGAMGQLWAVRSNGAEFPIEASISQTEAGGRKLFTVILRDITERRQAEAALRESQARLIGILQSATDAILTIGSDQKILLFNTAAEKMFGCASEEALGKPIERFIPQRFRIHHREHVRRFGETGITNRAMGQQGPLWGLRANGEEFPIEASISQIETASQKLFTVIIRDITERKRIEEALRASEERFRLLLDGVQEYAIYMLDPDGRVLSWNAGAARIKGYSSEEIVGKNFACFYTAEAQADSQPQRELEIARTQGRFEAESLRVRKDGSTFWAYVVLTPLYDSAGALRGFSKVARDITERKLASESLARQAEELSRSRQALAAQTRMLQSVLDSMAEGLIAADEQGKFLIWNRAAERIIGYGPADLPAQEWSQHYGSYLPDGVTPIPTEQLPLVRAMRGEANTAEILLRNPNIAHDTWIEASAGPLRDKDGVVSGGVVAFRDITQRKADEREIRILNDDLERRVIERTSQLEAANRELEAFTYSVSHDLRAPLRHIAGFSQMLAEESGGALPSQAQHYLHRIQEGTRRMGLLVDDLLNLARIGRHELRLQVTGLDSIVKDVIADLKPDTEERVVEWKISGLPYVEGDPALLKVVFQNLLSNALKYTRPRPKAVIEIGREEIEGAPVVFVRDNGVGFNMKYADKLFGVFQRLHRAEDFEGTGVGLATVQRIVQKHGGRVWAQAELDKGATFYFSLGSPREAPMPAEAGMAGETA